MLEGCRLRLAADRHAEATVRSSASRGLRSPARRPVAPACCPPYSRPAGAAGRLLAGCLDIGVPQAPGRATVAASAGASVAVNGGGPVGRAGSGVGVDLSAGHRLRPDRDRARRRTGYRRRHRPASRPGSGRPGCAGRRPRRDPRCGPSLRPRRPDRRRQRSEAGRLPGRRPRPAGHRRGTGGRGGYGVGGRPGRSAPRLSRAGRRGPRRVSVRRPLWTAARCRCRTSGTGRTTGSPIRSRTRRWRPG